MPNIREFQTPALNLRPNEGGVSTVAASARAIGGEYNEAGSAIASAGESLGRATRIAGEIHDDQVTHEEISRGGLGLAGLMASKTDQWNGAVKNADPNDSSVGQKFMTESLEPDLEKFKDGFTTQRSQAWADNHLNSFRQHMFNKTSADMATMAGEAVKVNYRQTTNSMANTVRNDPSALDFMLKTYEDTLDATIGSSPNLKGATAAAVRTELMQRGKEEIIKSAALGHIEATGTMPKWSTDPKYMPYITSGELKQLEQAEKNYRRLDLSEQRAQRAEQKYQASDDFYQKALALEARTMPKNPGDPPQLPADFWDTARDLAKHPGAIYHPGAISSLEAKGNAITRQLEKGEPLGPVSHEATMDLMRRIYSDGPDKLTDDKPIYQALFDGRLKNADFNFVRSEWWNMKSGTGAALGKERDEFFKRYEGFIDKDAPLGVRTADGQARLYQAHLAAQRAEEEAKRTGKDPHSIYDSDSPNFFGRSGNMQRFAAPSMQQKLQQSLPKLPPQAPTFSERFSSPEIKKATPPLITKKEDYDALEPGDMFYGAGGKAYFKPKK